MKKTFAICLLCLCACHLASQTTASVTLLTVNDGLSQGMIQDIMQGRDGFIWIATKDGLNRYDGARFEVFSPDPFDPFAFSSSEAVSLFEDSRGWIWVDYQQGVDLLDPVSGRFFHLMHEGKRVVTGRGAAMVETPDGHIWLSENDRIWKISPQKDMLAIAAKQGNANIELSCKPILMSAVSGWSGRLQLLGHLLFTKEKKLLVATDQGLFRLNPDTEQMAPELLIPDCHIEWMTESRSGEVLMRVRLPSGKLWALLSDGKVLYRKDPPPDYALTRFVFDYAGYFWAFRNGNIQKWQPSVFFNNGLPELEIPPTALGLENNDGYSCTDIMVDKSGIIWVGTSGYGVVKINDKRMKFKSVLQSKSHRMLYEDPEGGLCTTTLPDKKFLSNSFDHSVSNAEVDMLFFSYGARNFAFDAGNNAWWIVPNENQLCRMDAATKTRKNFPFEGHALLCDRNGRIVSVDEKGLHQFDPTTGTSRHFPFEKPQKKQAHDCNFLYEDAEGVVWVFGYQGLTKATPSQAGYSYQYYLNNPADRSSLSINYVQSVADDPLEPHRYLWIGTKGGGLNRLDKKSGKFKKYGREQGLPDNVVYGVLAQDRPKGSQSPGFIWMSTNKGLCRFDVRAETVKNFTVVDGLQDNEFNSGSYLKTRDGSMIFGGVKGLTAFHPDSLQFNEVRPQIHIVGLQVNNKPISDFGFRILGGMRGESEIRNPQSEIVLSHDQNLLNFEFAALEFTNSAQNNYRYQLVPINSGTDKDWVDLGTKNSIQFANLAPGDYLFKVDGSNNDGAWSGQPAELRFTIHPPWWASWWAYLMYFSMAVTAFWLYYRYRLRQKIAHQETLRLREINEFKSHFFTNITHEFRTPLTVILGNLEIEKLEIRKREEQGDPKISPFLNFLISKNTIIRRNAESLLRLINQILDLAKLESKTLKINYLQGDVLAFLRYIAESLHSFANAQNLLLRVESEQTAIEMDYDPERLLQIVHNLLSNAIKFTPSGGRVVMRADLKDKWLHISVSDSGAGIPEEELPFLFELFFQAKNQEHSKAGGTGIGLSLAAELVKALGGEISVESTVGKGSTFLVKLPVMKSPLTPKGEPTFGSSSAIPIFENTAVFDGLGSPLGARGLSHEGNPSILLIEDNPDVVEYLTACLQGSYVLDFAYNGRAGIEKALETIPELIVSDVMMPEKDGFEVVEALKHDERTSHIPIILLTAKADMESRIKGLRRGADAYLSKPFHQEELLLTVANLLEQRRKLQEKYSDWRLVVGDSTVQSPITSHQSPVTDPEGVFLQKIRSVVEANLTDADFEMPRLERALAMSRSQIFRKVKALTGKSPSLLIRSIRLQHGRHLLQTTNLTVSEIAYQLGYSAPSNFSDAFLEEFGERPTAVRG